MTTNRAKYCYPATILLCIVVVTLLLSGCSDDDSAGPKQIIPFSKANAWIYQDTSSNDMGVFASTDTVVITDSRTSHDTVWWKFTAPFNPYIDAREFAATADTIYSIQHTESPAGIRGILSKEYVSAPSSGSYTYNSLFTGDAFYEKTVKKLTKPVVTPAGTFNSCYEYTYYIYPDHITEIVCPGVGVIKIKVDGVFSGVAGSTPFNYTRTLIKYTLY